MRSVLQCGVLVVLCVSRSAPAQDPNQLLKLLHGAKSGDTVRKPRQDTRWTELPSPATSVAFSPDGKTLAIGLKAQVQLADVESKSLTRTIALKSGQVRALAFSSDGAILATGSYQNATLFNLATGDIVQELKGHRGYVTGLAYSKDGLRLATACEDELARIWALNSDAAPIVLKGHAYPVTGIAWSPDGRLIATSAGDDTRPTKPGQIRIWDAASGELKSPLEVHDKAATGVAFSRDGRFLLSTGMDERVNVYDLRNSKELGFFGGHSRPTNAVVTHPDEQTAISVSGGRAKGKNELMAWEYESGETVAAVEAHAAKINALALSPDGSLVATAGQDSSVAIWNFGFLVANSPTLDNPDAANTETSPPKTSIKPVAEAKAADVKPTVLRAGIIGLDTSHAEAFTKTLNSEPPVEQAEGVRVVAAYPKGSPDIKSSVERVPGYTEKLKLLGVKIVDSIDDLLKEVDVVLLETNDGRPHLEQLIPCLKAGKPTFIDKPISGSLTDAVAILELAKAYRVPVFCSSSLRFGKNSVLVRGGSIGKVIYCETSSPAHLEATHPDLYWYGIHGVESLFTVLGTGCESVMRGTTADGKIEVTGWWKGGKIGLFREGNGYTGKAIGENGKSDVGSYDGYDPLVFEIVKFFKTGKPPVAADETLEIYAFMEAADESKRQNGARITLESVLVKAQAEAAAKIAESIEKK